MQQYGNLCFKKNTAIFDKISFHLIALLNSLKQAVALNFCINQGYFFLWVNDLGLRYSHPFLIYPMRHRLMAQLSLFSKHWFEEFLHSHKTCYNL